MPHRRARAPRARGPHDPDVLPHPRAEGPRLHAHLDHAARRRQHLLALRRRRLGDPALRSSTSYERRHAPAAPAAPRRRLALGRRRARGRRAAAATDTADVDAGKQTFVEPLRQLPHARRLRQAAVATSARTSTTPSAPRARSGMHDDQFAGVVQALDRHRPAADAAEPGQRAGHARTWPPTSPRSPAPSPRAPSCRPRRPRPEVPEPAAPADRGLARPRERAARRRRAAIVTGASRGMGRAVAEAVAAEGAPAGGDGDAARQPRRPARPPRRERGAEAHGAGARPRRRGLGATRPPPRPLAALGRVDVPGEQRRACWASAGRWRTTRSTSGSG